ncbi:MAG: Ig-like domain-containing protein, partial [Prevotella sp.]|nr:Ig-like domain-containing protein [Prevotella sp.]
AESITLSQTSAQLKAGESVTLTASVLPETATDKTVTWSSSDEKVATVDKDGKVTAIAVGTATITATCGSVRATCTVSVVSTPAENITLSQTSAQLKAGESVILTASVLPETATDKTVTWSSSDETIATVDAEGNVTALAVGEATITATAADGSGVSASCQVTVLPILAESLTVSPESWTGEEGESFTLTATVLPENTTDKSVSWSSSNPEIATVNADGRVSVLKDGYCVITVSTLDGSELSAECIITCTSGIDELFTDADAKFNVYNLHGILIKKDCGRDYLRSLSTGTYILRQGNVSKKMIIR